MRVSVLFDVPSLRCPAVLQTVTLRSHRRHPRRSTRTHVTDADHTTLDHLKKRGTLSKKAFEVKLAELVTRNGMGRTSKQGERPPPTQWTEEQANTIFIHGFGSASKLLAHTL